MSEIIRINQGRIVPWQFRVAGTVLVFMLIFGAFTFLAEPIAILSAIIISFGLPLLWSSYYVLEIDPEEKYLSESAWIAGYKHKDIIRFHHVEKIFINPVSVSQNITSYSGHVYQHRNREFTAFLKLDSGEKFELISNKDPEKLFKKVQPMAEKLQCEIVNNSNK